MSGARAMRYVVPAALVLTFAAAKPRVAHPADASVPTPAASAAAAATAAAPVSGGVATDAIRVKEDGARWENAYGEKFFQVVGTVTNSGGLPVGAVRVRVELLDASGRVVKSFDAWNARAEALGDLDDVAAGEMLAELGPGPIAPGESDRFRSTFLADETPAFDSHRVRVVAVLPPA